MEEKVVSSTPESPKKSNTLLIAIVVVVLLFGCCIVSAVVGYFLLKNKADKSVFINGENYPPVSQKFLDEMKDKEHKLSDEYSFYTNAVGKPAYSFSMLVHEDWKEQARESDEIYFEWDTAEGYVDYGMMFFDVTMKEYKDMTCKEIVENLFDDDGEELLTIDSEDVNINGEKWSRVIYTVKQGEYTYNGIDQCLKKDDGLLYQYLYAWDEYFVGKESEFYKVMDEVYVYDKSLDW